MTNREELNEKKKQKELKMTKSIIYIRKETFSSLMKHLFK
jgi:hypothetical protein